MTEKDKTTLRSLLIDWFRHEGRVLPWRETDDPYKIWVSEVILQQTQVVQGHDYYLRFVEHFPTVETLAEAPIEEVLRLWQGLGYYSRAHNMHHAAKTIVSQYRGVFPQEKRDVDKLKGIGPYTSAAIMSIAYNQPWAVVDGNVYRVLSRLTASPIPIDTTQGQKHFRALAQELLSYEQPSLYNQAIMDFGAMICTPQVPKCDVCPLASLCQSYETDLVNTLPVKKKKIVLKSICMDFLLIRNEFNEILLEQRDRNGIWKGLYQFPLFHSENKLLSEHKLQHEIAPFALYLHTDILPLHRLTHRELHIRIHHFSTMKNDLPATFLDGCFWSPLAQHHTFAFPIPLRKFLDTWA